MNKEQAGVRTFTRRAFFVGALQISFLGVLGARLAWLQIAQGARYKMLSDKNRINLKILAPPRGQIVDRFGVPLAVNNQNFRVLVIPEQTDSVEKSLRALQNFISVDEKRIKAVLDQAKRSAKFVPLEIRDALSWEEVATVEVNIPDLPGILIDVGEVRSYPFGDSTAHIIGYVGAPAKADLTGDQLLKLPGFKVGKTGIEKTFDADMRGKAGSAQVEVNVVGREVRELSRNESEPGRRVTLTIDAELQRFVQARLAMQKSASAVIMDIHDGAVYALASHPSFDPNLFSRGISAATWEELLADPGHPLTNKAIAGQYPPASTFKMVTALAGLRAGVMNSTKTVYCPGHFKFGDSKFHCWKPGGHGYVDIKNAISKSCDTFFYHYASEIGIDRLAEVAREMGVGEKFAFELAEERPGLVPDKNWKTGFMGQSWQPGETIIASIGQGYLQATPLQLAVMVARLISGKQVKPWIAGYIGDRPGVNTAFADLKIDKAHMALIKRGMEMVMEEGGTAYGSRIPEEQYAMAGKTGTAQVRRITMQQRLQGVKNEDLPWHFRHHGLFVGYAPMQAPRYACAVVVEHGVGGAASAAPIAKDIMLEVQKRDPAKTPLQPETPDSMADSQSHAAGGKI